jgi:alpha-1,2-mannosyltransferase
VTQSQPSVRHWPLPVLGLFLTGVGLVAAFMAGYFLYLGALDQIDDFTVYREAVAHWLGGGDLYSFAIPAPDGGLMPFTYPPFAAVLMVPTTWLPLRAGWWVAVVIQLGCLLALATLLARRTGVLNSLGRPERVAVVAAGWVGLIASEPAAHGIFLGQVSLILIAVAVLDAAVVPPRWRGLLTGVAAAVKIVPGIFLLYYLVTRQWRAAVNTAVGAIVVTAIGFAVLPGSSWQYWTRLIFETSRIGEPEVTRNKSLLGLLSHLGLAGTGRTVLWLVLAVLVTALGLWHVRRRYREGAILAAVFTTGLVSSVISPISWPHHLVWLPLAGLYLAYCPGWRRWLGLGVLIGFFAGTPLLSYRGDLSPALMILGDVTAVVLMLGAAVGVPGRPGGELRGEWPSGSGHGRGL